MNTTFWNTSNLSLIRVFHDEKNNLLDILLLAIIAVMLGNEGGEDIENFGHIKRD